MRNMRLAEIILNRPLMISEQKLNVILHVLGPRFNLDLSGLAPVSGAQDIQLAQISDRERARAGYYVQNGLGVIGIHGPLMHRLLASDFPSGGPTTYSDIRRAFDMALVDDGVEGIVFDIDSPGGEANGVFDLADHIYASRGIKPSTSIIDEFACSAAYLLGAAAGKIYIPKTGAAGSIGVIATHADLSRAEDAMGITVTHIYAGARKADFSPHMPLSPEAVANMQESVNETYDMFAKAVARYRNIDVKDVKATEAGIFKGKKAVDLGLADEVSPADRAMMKAGRRRPGSKSVTGGRATAEIQKGGQQMTKSELQELNPALYTEVFEEGRAMGLQEASKQTPSAELIDAARKEGATVERERIKSIEDAAVPGHDELIARLKYDGATTAAEAALQILGAEKQLRAGALTVMKEGANPVVAAVEPVDEVETPVSNLPLEERCKAAWDKSADLQAEFAGSFERFLAFEKASASGQAKIYKK